MKLMTEIPLEPGSDEDCTHFEFNGQGRLILGTMHGEVIIDIRLHDVNAFTLHSGRIDNLLIPPKRST